MIIPPGYGHVRVIQGLNGDNEFMLNTFGVDLSAAGGNYEDAVAQIYGAWNGNVTPNSSNQSNLFGVDLVVGQDGLDPIVVSTNTVPVAGGRSISMPPQNTCVLVQKRTALGGRRNRGRMYVPNLLADADVSDLGDLTGAWQAALQTSFDNLLTALDTGLGGSPIPTPMVILHGTVGIPTPVTSLIVSGKAATQRQRMRR